MGVNMPGESPCIQESGKKVTKTHAHTYSCTLWYRTVTSRPEILITPVAALSLTVCTARSKPISQSIPYNPHSLVRRRLLSPSPHTQIYIRTRILLLLLLYVYTEEAVVAMTFFSAAPLRRPRRRFNSVPRCAHLWAPRVRL